ncbi:hypothetical protein DWG18_10990 [Lysobacter sp. TY2-98]|uniref:hypothetical protein n=1 Tax=Lysobacter sp. TY2-98 TaxID=2290922 RepID=UPI000E20877E|nr:hypothetical protein [Lysobacter sp. TY2-98]AXK72750.1 hypothetical protein DWG18_10990 [Lysobacter sp. TY2-98]
MPLLIALALLVAVVALGIVLGVVGLVRRPFRRPVWQPVFGPPLTLRALMLTIAVLVAFAVAAWRHPDAVTALAWGLGVGLVLGAGAATTAELRRQGRFVEQRPHRLFMVLLAVAVLLRAALSTAGGLAMLPADMRTTLPMLAGLLGGYPLAHALVLRARLRRFARLHGGT